MAPIDFFWRAARRWGQGLAVQSRAETLTYRDLAARVAAGAQRLLDQEATPGTYICVGGANTADHLIAILSVLAANKVWVPLNPRNGDEELQAILDYVDPDAIIVDDELASRLPGCDVTPMAISGPAGEEATLPPDTRSLSETQAVKFTGGTTGQPKGVCQPIRAWNANIVTQMHELRLSATDRYLVSAPLTHGASTYLIPILAVGGSIIFPDEATAPAILNAAQTYGATFTFGPPALLSNLVEEQTRAPRSLPSLRLLIYGGAPMRAEQIGRTQDCFGPILAATFGQTEAPQIITYLPPAEMTGDRQLSVGWASLMTRVAILDQEGQVLRAGEQGEIAVRGDLVMSGYLKSPAAAAESFRNGWLCTGDIGVIDQDGFLFIRDRLRDVVITGGFNVFPGDVEAVIDRNPQVADCSVVGIEDPKWGEAVHAAVVPCAGQTIDCEAMLADIRRALGPIKTPKGIHLFDTLPKSPVGKILKTELRAQIVQRLSGRTELGGQ